MAKNNNELSQREKRIIELEADIVPKRVIFCHEYLECNYNSAKAAIKAGYTEHTARAQGFQILKCRKVKELVSLLAEEHFIEARVSHIRVLEELGDIAFYDIRNYYNEDGSRKKINELTKSEAAAVVGITETTLGFEGKGKDKTPITKIEFKMGNKEKALELIGKHHKMFSDMLIDVNVNIGDQVAAGRKRVKEMRGVVDADSE